MHAGGVSGACFFVVNLSGGEVRFKVTPCFICIWFLIPFFNGVGKDTCVTEDGFFIC